MTDNEIIKALECCNGYDCETCRALKYCDYMHPGALARASLDLINRQKAEIERLQKENERWKNGFMGACMLENCKLKDEWKSEAIKEFAKQLKGYTIGENGSKEKAYFFVEVQDIDNLVEEMTEANK